jgi:hypothetical protein
MDKIKLKSKRRGLASIVGILFFIVLMVGAFTALLAAFSFQNDLIDTQKTVADQEVAKARENFFVISDIDTDKLYVTIKNQGTNPVEIANLWVIEKNTLDKLATQYDVGYGSSAVPIATSKNITSNTITLDPAFDYSVKVVSRLGTIVSVDVPDNTTPPGPQGEQGPAGLHCWDTDEDGIFDYIPGPSSGPPAEEDVNDNDLAGIEDCAGGPAGPPGPPGDPGASLVLNDDLLNKPGIFLTFPSPFGNSPDNKNALWGAMIANPTDQIMEISKIVFTVSSPRASSADQIFAVGGSSPPSGDNCGPNPTSILPNPNTNAIWRCVTENQLVWIDTTTSGAQIPPRSAKSFFTSISPGSLQSAGDVEGFLIVASVSTNMGQFGKTGYVAAFRNTEGVIANVYLSDMIGSVATDHMFGDFTISPLGTKDVYINLADFETQSSGGASPVSTNWIKSGAKVIVNVPRNFTVTTSPATILSDSPGFSSVVFVNDTSNDSVQIQGTTNVDIGNLPVSGGESPAEARTLKFTIRAPDQTKDKLYVMYTLAKGNYSPDLAVGVDADIGPVAEILIKVDVP